MWVNSLEPVSTSSFRYFSWMAFWTADGTVCSMEKAWPFCSLTLRVGLRPRPREVAGAWRWAQSAKVLTELREPADGLEYGPASNGRGLAVLVVDKLRWEAESLLGWGWCWLWLGWWWWGRLL